MKLSLTAAILTTSLALCACRSRPTKVVVASQAPPPSTVVVQQDHTGHYFHNGVWYAEPEHVTIVKGN